MQSPIVLARTAVLRCLWSWSFPSCVSEERKWLKILWFGSVPCSRKNLSLHRKCKNWKTKNISLFQNPIRKNWCSQKCKIFTLVAFLDFSVQQIFFSKLLKRHVLCQFFSYFVPRSYRSWIQVSGQWLPINIWGSGTSQLIWRGFFDKKILFLHKTP